MLCFIKYMISYKSDTFYNRQLTLSFCKSCLLLVLLKASKYDAMQKADVKSKKLKNKPRVIRSGTGRSKGEDSKSKHTAKMKRLRSSGHVDDAASILEDLFNS